MPTVKDLVGAGKLVRFPAHVTETDNFDWAQVRAFTYITIRLSDNTPRQRIISLRDDQTLKADEEYVRLGPMRLPRVALVEVMMRPADPVDVAQLKTMPFEAGVDEA